MYVCVYNFRYAIKQQLPAIQPTKPKTFYNKCTYLL